MLGELNDFYIPRNFVSQADGIIASNIDINLRGKINLLYVDDEINDLTSFISSFKDDFNIFVASSGEKGLEILKEVNISVIIADQRMPQMTGVEFLVEVFKEYPKPIKILLTAFTDSNIIIDAINKGKIYYYLSKPFNAQLMREVVKKAYEIFETRENGIIYNEQLIELNDQLDFFVRQSLLS